MSLTSRGRHARNPTWPPTIQLLPDIHQAPFQPMAPSKDQLAAIDEDPFSHFLSPVLDEDDAYEDSIYSAGIDAPYTLTVSSSQKHARFRARLEEKWEGFVARRLLAQGTSPATAGFGLGLALSPPLPQTPPDETQLPDLMLEDAECEVDLDVDTDAGATTPEFELAEDPLSVSLASSPTYLPVDNQADGWELDRRRTVSAPPAPRFSLRFNSPSYRQTHTLSGKRHAWRSPSEDLWTVLEENEDDEVQRNRLRRKRAKSVHWAEEVQVVEYER